MTHMPLDGLVPDYIKSFEVYIPSKPDDVLMRLYRTNRLFRLNNNENPLGPCPAAQDVIRKFNPPRASVYPSGDGYHLRIKLAEYHGIHPDQILAGNGANEVIAFVIKAFCQEGDNIITADKTFAVYEWVAQFSGYEARLVPLKDFGFDDREMLRQIDDRTKVLFVCNPNNPTGSYWPEQKLRNFLDVIDGRKIVVLDEAYFEFVDQPDFPDGIKLLAEYPNLVVFRTFSKMFALAGLRIGYLAGSTQVVDIIRRTCVTYSINTMAQEAAEASVGALDHVLRTRELIKQGKRFLKRELNNMGLDPVAGEGNFVMVKLPVSDTLAYRKLMSRGVMIRTMSGFRFPNWIRISIGKMEALEAFIQALDDVLRQEPEAMKIRG